MLKLVEINEENWQEVAKLTVEENQKAYLDSAVGIIARGYVYRSCRVKVIGIADDRTIIGVALVKDLDYEPACYDLQQFMIDKHFQGKGFGTEALCMVLHELEKEKKYDCVEVCVNKENKSALRIFEKVGFSDTGYIDDSVPDCLNLRYRFPNPNSGFSDDLVSDFCDLRFQEAFHKYFSELGITVTDWESLFREMNDEGDNKVYIRSTEEGNIIGFIQFKKENFTSWFFEETVGFIREFWVAEEYRNSGHGAALLRLAEDYFRHQGIYTSILTTDTAEHFYLRNGYRKAPGCKAKNKDEVFIKQLI
ncbi:MAG TPA: GNAT family N-acetyltransferase [Clostridiales bacterium]|nr:GNAT family N-acetyltransferase [Clostridiales bacterium]